MSRVLICCEESQSLCLALRAYGIEAYSCDIKPCSGGHPEYHIQDDCFVPLLEQHWDAVVAHPPCTYLAKSGACNFTGDPIVDQLRTEAMLNGRQFFLRFVEYADTQPGVPLLIENPVPMRKAGLPPYSFTLCPSSFGSPYSKLTCYWAYNGFPYIHAPYPYRKGSARSWVASVHGSTMRSKSFDCISAAIAKNLFNFFAKRLDKSDLM